MTAPRQLWIGTYTPDSDPDAAGSGIHRARLDPGTGALSGGEAAVGATGPSFLAAHPRGGVLYAVSECDAGIVTGFAVSETADGSTSSDLARLGAAPTGGSAPCHVLAHPEGRHVITANYADGRVSVHALADSGAPQEAVAVLEHTGHGPNQARQEGPHAHSVAMAPGGRHILVADLGTDELRCHAFDAAAADPVGPATALGMAPGTGPRHLAVHPSGHIYVAGELDSRVHVLAWDSASAQAVPASEAAASGHEGPNHPGEIAISPDGERVYVSNRGADTIATFEVTGGGAGLRRIAETPCGGAWPRHFALTDGHIVVANQRSAELSSLRLGPDGVPADTGHRLTVSDPACVLPG